MLFVVESTQSLESEPTVKASNTPIVAKVLVRALLLLDTIIAENDIPTVICKGSRSACVLRLHGPLGSVGEISKRLLQQLCKLPSEPTLEPADLG